MHFAFLAQLDLEQIRPNDTQRAQAFDQIQKWIDESRKTPKAVKRADLAHTEVQAEVATLSETAQAKLERLAAALRGGRFQHDVEIGIRAKVAERFKLQQEYLSDQQTRLNVQLEQLSIREKTLDQWMTRDEFRLVMGCLHPDRQPEDQRTKYGQAFLIFKRLEQHLEPDGRVLRGRGWQ